MYAFFTAGLSGHGIQEQVQPIQPLLNCPSGRFYLPFGQPAGLLVVGLAEHDRPLQAWLREQRCGICIAPGLTIMDLGRCPAPLNGSAPKSIPSGPVHTTDTTLRSGRVA